MSVTSTTNRVKFAGSGTSGPFAFPYYFDEFTDIKATITNNTTGAISNLIYPSGYTISGSISGGVYPDGGNVTTTVAVASGTTLTLWRDPDHTQEVEWNSTVDPNKELSVDKLTLLVQRIFDLLGRSVGLNDGFTASFDPSLPTVMTPGYGLAVNGTGTGWDLVPVAGDDTGTVTEVGLDLPAEFAVGGPITTTGNLAASWIDQAENLVFAGPESGAEDTPSFRPLVPADLPLEDIDVADLTSGIASNGDVPHADGLGGVDWSPAGSGTVESVGLVLPEIFETGAPVTTTGNLSATLASQPIGKVFASPSAGVPGVPSFRTLARSDLPGMVGATSSADGDTGVVPKPVTGQEGLFLRGDASWASAPDGTVKSIDVAVPSNEFQSTGGPVTANGTITISKKNQAANSLWAGPASGASAQPTFRGMVAADMIDMVGATNVTSGTRGAVPAPNAGDEAKFLRGDGHWAVASGGGGGGATTFTQTVVYAGEASIDVDVGSAFTNARNALWQLQDMANDFEVMFVKITIPTLTTVRITVDPPLPNGNYHLFGVGA